MERIITYENLRCFCYANDHLITTAPRGIVIDFMGLNGNTMHSDDPEQSVRLAQHGLIHVIPYANPWNWMNDETIAFCDTLLDTLRERYGALPVVSCGGSMGGLCSLIYTRYASVTPVACVANCPVCDLVFHYTERPDLPRTLYSAYAGSAAPTLEEAMALHSPLHQVSSMPDCSYTVFHCTADKAVNIDSHSAKFVSAMSEAHRIAYHTIPDRGHCDLGEEGRAHYWQCIIDSFDAK